MTFEEWAKTKSDDLYEEIEFMLSEGAMTGDDIYIQLQQAYEAGWNGSIDRVVSDRATEAGGWVEIHYDDFIGYKIGASDEYNERGELL